MTNQETQTDVTVAEQGATVAPDTAGHITERITGHFTGRSGGGIQIGRKSVTATLLLSMFGAGR